MHQATEALERQLQVRRTLRKSIDSVNDRGASAFFAQAGSLRDDAYQWANDFTMLGLAQPMYWTSDTSDAVAAMAPSFDLAAITCSRELLHSDVAFCWFEKPPMKVTLRTRGDTDLRALAWAFVASKPTLQPILALTAYAVKDEILQPVGWTNVADGELLNSYPQPSSSSGLTTDELDRWRKQCAELFQFVVCASAFLRQKIAAAEPIAADRHARKRAAAASWQGDPIVSFIQLREREQRVADTEAHDDASRQFKWRWMVRAHTRQQFYPSLGKTLPILIGPYIKGPEDKPFKPRTQPIIVVNR